MVMNFTVTGKQIDVGDALRTHIESSVGALVTKYFGEGLEGHAVVRRDAGLICCDLSVHIGRNIQIQVSEKDHDPRLACDKAAERIGKRMRRYKDRLKDHHQANGGERKTQEASAAQYAILRGPDDGDDDEDDSLIDPTGGQPTVIAEMMTEVPTLTVSEAVMRMDLTATPALMFRNSAHGGLNVIYRRTDGHIGWVDPGARG